MKKFAVIAMLCAAVAVLIFGGFITLPNSSPKQAESSRNEFRELKLSKVPNEGVLEWFICEVSLLDIWELNENELYNRGKNFAECLHEHPPSKIREFTSIRDSQNLYIAIVVEVESAVEDITKPIKLNELIERHNRKEIDLEVYLQLANESIIDGEALAIRFSQVVGNTYRDKWRESLSVSE